MKEDLKSKRLHRARRHRRVRARVSGNSSRPRLNVFRSNKHLYAQIVDDTNHQTVLSVNDLKLKDKNRIKRAKMVGEKIASQALEMGINRVVFDRGGFKYHGLVKTIAEAARLAGLRF